MEQDKWKSFEEVMGEFIATLDDQEKIIREMNIKHKGDMVAVATELGIAKTQAIRLTNRAY